MAPKQDGSSIAADKMSEESALAMPMVPMRLD